MHLHTLLLIIAYDRQTACCVCKIQGKCPHVIHRNQIVFNWENQNGPVGNMKTCSRYVYSLAASEVIACVENEYAFDSQKMSGGQQEGISYGFVSIQQRHDNAHVHYHTTLPALIELKDLLQKRNEQPTNADGCRWVMIKCNESQKLQK
ncbi:hypothetical protein SUGI_0815670 [Cryptomeria japonica]|nr:hypothetical protein SUGI_0815670 [Cryptomeria japonica]